MDLPRSFEGLPLLQSRGSSFPAWAVLQSCLRGTLANNIFTVNVCMPTTYIPPLTSFPPSPFSLVSLAYSRHGTPRDRVYKRWCDGCAHSVLTPLTALPVSFPELTYLPAGSLYFARLHPLPQTCTSCLPLTTHLLSVAADSGFLRFHMSVRSYRIHLSPADLTHVA